MTSVAPSVTPSKTSKATGNASKPAIDEAKSQTPAQTAASAPSTAVPPASAPSAANPGVVDPVEGKDGKKTKKRKRDKNKRKGGKPGKIHIRLPGPEAYRKEICFPAEAPGRVVVRLERLMGSDKIRPVDGKYMETLIQRLEEEEKLAWDRKIRLRKKAETERYRQLAINGLMEPGPGMEDLYNHPVFRVNRIFNRLDKLNHQFFDHRSLKMPPIENVDPFQDDDTGSFFTEYPFHKQLKDQWQRYKGQDDTHKGEVELLEEEEEEEEDEPVEESRVRPKSMLSLRKQESGKEIASQKASKSKHVSKKATQVDLTDEEEEEGEEQAEPRQVTATQSTTGDDEDEYDEELDLGETSSEWYEEEEGEGEKTKWDLLREAYEREYNQSLDELMEKYGCPKTDGFEERWKPYRSELVDILFSDYNSMEELYEGGKGIFELYARQDIATREHIKTAHEPFVYPGETKTLIAVGAEDEAVYDEVMGTMEQGGSEDMAEQDDEGNEEEEEGDEEEEEEEEGGDEEGEQKEEEKEMPQGEVEVDGVSSPPPEVDQSEGEETEAVESMPQLTVTEESEPEEDEPPPET